MNNNKSKDGLQDIRNSTFYKEVHEAIIEGWVKAFHIDEPMLQLIKERARYHKIYLQDFFWLLSEVNIIEGKDPNTTPSEETIKRAEKEVKNYKRSIYEWISDQCDDSWYRYDPNNEPFR